MMKKKWLIVFLILTCSSGLFAQQDDPFETEVVDQLDVNNDPSLESIPEVDDLAEIKKDTENVAPTESVASEDSKPSNFETSAEEKELLEIAQNFSTKMTDEQWNQIAQGTSTTSYTVQKGDWLFKISKMLFGTGFYYPKIWALNPYITNPHEIEPGMVLVLNTGSGENAPQVYVEGENAISVSDESQESEMLNPEFAQYQPQDDFSAIPASVRNEDWSHLKDRFSFKLAHFLNAFISDVEIKKMGVIDSALEESIYLKKGNTVYVKFEDSVTPSAGEVFSIYNKSDKVKHKKSDRKGYEYAILAQLKVVGKYGNLWEAKIIESVGRVGRGDFITTFINKLEDVAGNASSKNIDGIVISSFNQMNNYPSVGDIVYLDRGRSDGVAVGDLFQTNDGIDRSTSKMIQENGRYKTAELKVLAVNDQFSTAVVVKNYYDFKVGDSVSSKLSSQVADVKAYYRKTNKAESNFDRLDKTIDQMDQQPVLDSPDSLAKNKATEINSDEADLAEKSYGKKYLDEELNNNDNPFGLSEYDVEEVDELLNTGSLKTSKSMESKNDSVDMNFSGRKH